MFIFLKGPKSANSKKGLFTLCLCNMSLIFIYCDKTEPASVVQNISEIEFKKVVDHAIEPMNNATMMILGQVGRGKSRLRVRRFVPT